MRACVCIGGRGGGGWACLREKEVGWGRERERERERSHLIATPPPSSLSLSLSLCIDTEQDYRTTSRVSHRDVCTVSRNDEACTGKWCLVKVSQQTLYLRQHTVCR